MKISPYLTASSDFYYESIPCSSGQRFGIPGYGEEEIYRAIGQKQDASSPVQLEGREA
jgi:hypothetical protein